MSLPNLCTSTLITSSPTTCDLAPSHPEPRGLSSMSRDQQFREILAEVADIHNLARQLRQKHHTLRTQVEDYRSHDYTFHRIRERAKRLKDSKLGEIKAMESPEITCNDCEASFRSKHFSDGSSGSSKSFYDEVEEMMEDGQVDFSEISGMLGMGDSSGDSSVFEN